MQKTQMNTLYEKQKNSCLCVTYSETVFMGFWLHVMNEIMHSYITCCLAAVQGPVPSHCSVQWAEWLNILMNIFMKKQWQKHQNGVMIYFTMQHLHTFSRWLCDWIIRAYNIPLYLQRGAELKYKNNTKCFVRLGQHEPGQQPVFHCTSFWEGWTLSF